MSIHEDYRRGNKEDQARIVSGLSSEMVVCAQIVLYKGIVN